MYVCTFGSDLKMYKSLFSNLGFLVLANNADLFSIQFNLSTTLNTYNKEVTRNDSLLAERQRITDDLIETNSAQVFG